MCLERAFTSYVAVLMCVNEMVHTMYLRDIHFFRMTGDWWMGVSEKVSTCPVVHHLSTFSLNRRMVRLKHICKSSFQVSKCFTAGQLYFPFPLGIRCFLQMDCLHLFWVADVLHKFKWNLHVGQLYLYKFFLSLTGELLTILSNPFW